MAKKKDNRLLVDFLPDGGRGFPRVEPKEIDNAYREIKAEQKKVSDYVGRIQRDIRAGARPARKRFHL